MCYCSDTHCSFQILTDIFSGPTVHVEGIVAKLVVRVGSLKQKSVGAELLLRNFSDTLVVFVALLGVGEEAVWFRTPERSSV